MESSFKALKLNEKSSAAAAAINSLDVDSSSDEDDYEINNNEEQTSETSVDVGLIDDTEDLINTLSVEDRKLLAIRMSSPFFPSKVGGKPAWLDYSHAPKAIETTTATAAASSSNTNHVACDSCKNQLVFLLQLYAPISFDTDKFADQVESPVTCFHRTLFVFVCTNTACNRKSVKLLRSQLARENEFYAFDAPPREDDFENGMLLFLSLVIYIVFLLP